MRNKNKTLSLILILLGGLMAFLSCKDDEQPCRLEHVETPFDVPCKTYKDLDSIKKYINGTWTWLQEERPIRGLQVTKYFTPETEGYSRTLTLFNDTAIFYKCNTIVATYKFDIIRLKEISGTSFPEDEDPVLILYDLQTGIRYTHVPVRICPNYLILQNQFVSSIIGPNTYMKL